MNQMVDSDSRCFETAIVAAGFIAVTAAELPTTTELADFVTYSKYLIG
jgi:hypothetical protein